MLDGISNAAKAQAMQQFNAADNITDEQAKEEFLTLFYKEMLKQSFKAPRLSMADENNTSFSSMFSSEIMVNKIAGELARRQIKKL